MSAPDPLRTPQIFRAVGVTTPIPRSPALNFLTVVEEDGTEWCESYDVPRIEAKEDEEILLAYQKQIQEEEAKQKAIAEQQMLQQYRQRLFKNVLDGSIPPAKK